MTLDMDSSVVAVTSVASSDLGEEAVLMDIDSGKYFVLNEVSAEIWRAIQTPCRVGALCDTLAATYAAPAEQIQASTLAFLRDLHEKRLLREVSDDQPA